MSMVKRWTCAKCGFTSNRKGVIVAKNRKVCRNCFKQSKDHMSDENNLEQQSGEVLSNTEQLTRQEPEDEIMSMLTALSVVCRISLRISDS